MLVLVALVLQRGCAMGGPRVGAGPVAPTHYAQSMNSAVDGCLRNPACAASTAGKEADFQVNEREYGPGGMPDDAECERVVRNEKGESVKRRIELGTMKHELAFACVRRELLMLFPDNISIERRYGKDPATGRYSLTEVWDDSLRPDIVLHSARNPNKVQCVYDFKFPCSRASKKNPLSTEAAEQLRKYDDLGGNCPSAIVTPQLGINHD